MTTSHYDVAVVGGGIHGVGVAQAAAAAGYRVALFEQTAIAAGTSSRSSKLIHGGLRYLESGQFTLVRESLRERDLLLKLAPKLVRPVSFYIPVYRHTRRGPWMIWLGLFVYSLLDGFRPMSRFRRIPKAQWSGLEGLVTENLRAVFQYRDAQTNDRELTEVVMRSAQVLGARLFCPAEVTGIEQIKSGYRLRFQQTDQSNEITCAYLVNATGPWANRFLEKVSPEIEQLEMELVQGSHIILAGSMQDKVFYLEAPRDGRAVFVMPWENNTTLVGTTEHVYEGDPAKVSPLPDEIDYLLETVKHYFPDHSDEVIDSFAGLRVLPKQAHAAFHRPRETILHTTRSHPRLLTIYGGKLTAYRSTAGKVVQILGSALGSRRKKVDTKNIYLTRTDNIE